MKKKLSKQLLGGFAVSLVFVGGLTLWINQNLLQDELDSQVKNIATSITYGLEFATEGLLEYGDTQILQRMVQNYATLPKVIDIDIIDPDSKSLVKPNVSYANPQLLSKENRNSFHDAAIIFYLQKAMDTGTEQIVHTKVNGKLAFVHILPFSSSLFRNNIQGKNFNGRGATIVALDLQQVKQEAWKTFLTTTLTMLMGTLAILILMMLLIEHYAIRPLERLDKSIHDSQETGVVDLPDSHQLPNNEIRYLAETLDIAIAQLRKLEIEKNTELRKINNDLAKLSESLEMKVIARTAEITTANIELQKAKEIAQESSKAKSLFLANMSHELRTPLNAILGFTQLMSDDESTSEHFKEQLSIIYANGQQLLNLINSILVAARIESVKQSLNNNIFCLNDLLDKIKVIIKSKIEQKHLVFIIENDIKGIDIHQNIEADELKLEQILINLLNNAIKFTDKGKITLKIYNNLNQGFYDIEAKNNYQNDAQAIKQQQKYLFFEIEDTGIGIADNDLDKIFQPFFQVASEQRFYEGTGLGLSITKQFVNLMGGDISVSSVLDRGSVFRFYIPVKVITPAISPNIDSYNQENISPLVEQSFNPSIVTAEHKLLNSDQVNSDQADQSNENHFANVNETPSPFNKSLLNRKLNILLAEDNQFNQIITTRMLEKLGYKTDIVNDGVEVLERLQNQQYDIIFMDIQMPRMDGLEAAKCVYEKLSAPKDKIRESLVVHDRASEQFINHYSLPLIIALTANASQETKESCFAVGMYDYVTKPVSIETLDSVLQKAISYIDTMTNLNIGA
ncbi:MAG: ATP-binding protein [Pseudanabaenaceae cyanobacterium bins.39]|nr:ATP-binding protein [Pseudanabaenaceae cyanobacterium bins.39]